MIGIDLAALGRNPTGWVLLKGKAVRIALIYADNEILGNKISNHPALIATDAPSSLPKKDAFFRKAEREIIRKGYRVFSSNLPVMKKLTLRAIRLNRLIEEKCIKQLKCIQHRPEKHCKCP